MASLSSDQLTDLQADIGITTDESVFTDAELNRLYTRADSDYNTAVYLALRQLMANAVKFHDYTAGQTSVKKSQIFDHLKEQVDFWQKESRTTANQVRIVGSNRIPPRSNLDTDSYPDPKNTSVIYRRK